MNQLKRSILKLAFTISNIYFSLKGIIRAQELGVPITIHAGEWPEKFGSLSNLKFAIDHIKANRIGHAIAFRSDVQYLKEIASTSSDKITKIEVI